MKKYTDKELEIIMDDIINGTVYVGIKDSFSWGYISCGYGYIFFTNYGQTASKKIFEHFKSTLYIMFSDCDEIVPGVYSQYHIGYIPQDTKKYKCIDYSTSHPNIYGL
jgi:hypothetical protein